MTAVPRVRPDRLSGTWLFATPFRPFFLGASLLAAASVPLWIHLYATGAGTVGGMPGPAFHAHEMVFGYLPAVMAGYLLSATPNWSGRLPTAGAPLAGLFAIWLAGRLLPPLLPALPAAVVDVAFPLAVAAVLMREARVKAAGMSRHGLMLFPLLAAASLAHRLMAEDYEAETMLARLGIAVGALLIAAVGGRLVPSLTRNALAGSGADRVPEPYGRFDVAVLVAAFAGLAGFVAAPEHPATAVLALAAGAMHLVRLARWRGWLLRDGGVLALHAGYLWLAAGTILAGLAAEPVALVPVDAALHALAAGAIGGMTLAVMTRLAGTRGGGARPGGAIAGAALVAVNAGALLRLAAPLLPAHHLPLVAAGGALWAAGFALFALSMIGAALGGARRSTPE